MTHENEKHSTKEFRCEEFRKLGLNDSQIETVEGVIFEHYLDYGVIDSVKKIKDKERKMRVAAENTRELINSIKSIMGSHPNDYTRFVKSVTFGVNNFLLEINNSKEDNAKQWAPVKISPEDIIKKIREMLSSEKKLDCPAPLPYLEIIERSFSYHSCSTHEYKGFKTFEDEGLKKAIVFELYSNKNPRSGVNSKTYSYHYKALHDLTMLWQVKLKNKAIKSDDSNFMRFLSVVFYGKGTDTGAMRKYYKSNYNVKSENYAIDNNEI